MFYTQTILAAQNMPLQLSRRHWERILHWLGDYIHKTVVEDVLDQLLRAVLMQIFIKLSKHVQKLQQKSKPMESLSTLQFTPCENYGLQYTLAYESEGIELAEERHFFTAYLQPILNHLHQFEINHESIHPTHFREGRDKR